MLFLLARTNYRRIGSLQSTKITIQTHYPTIRTSINKILLTVQIREMTISTFAMESMPI